MIQLVAEMFGVIITGLIEQYSWLFLGSFISAGVVVVIVFNV